MRQSSKVEASNSSSSATGLHPVLSLALANLDIQLEDELVRYRRQRTAGRAVPPSGRKQPSSQLDLIAIAATATNNGMATQPALALEERLTSVADPTIAPDGYKPIPAFTANPQPFEAALTLRNPDSPTSTESADNAALFPGDGTHALAQANIPDLDDYLESSEELLRSLADEQAEVQAERSFMQSLLTPLGLGSMLLLLLSSAMFGYVIMNPSSLGWLTAQRNTPTTPSDQSTGSGVISSVPPNLPNAQLPVLNPNNLGTLDPGTPSPATSSSSPAVATLKNKPTIAAAKTSTASQPGSESSAAPAQAPIPAVTSSSSKPYSTQSASRPASIRTYEPPQAAASSQPSVAPSRSAPKIYSPPVVPATRRSTAPTAARLSTDAYPIKVITPYDGDSALTKSQAVVPDAYLRNFPTGAKIQLGAYDDRALAEAKAQELRSRGIPAEVYKP